MASEFLGGEWVGRGSRLKFQGSNEKGQGYRPLNDKLFEFVFLPMDSNVFDEKMTLEELQYVLLLGLLDNHPVLIFPSVQREVRLQTALAVEQSVGMAFTGFEDFHIVRGLAVQPRRDIGPRKSNEGVAVAQPEAQALTHSIYPVGDN
jgi:hypothetical protein